jgi:putative hemolysin
MGTVEGLHSFSKSLLKNADYSVRLAQTEQERAAAYRLRFLVFNLELNEGLESSYETGFDTDEFDDFCDHLIVEHAATGRIVGTYRLQSGFMAAKNRGYYSEREFSFAPYEAVRTEVIELGRACIHRKHRSTEVLYLLWKGIALYALERGARYLIGCCSLTSQDAAHGTAVYNRLREHRVAPALSTVPLPEFALDLSSRDAEADPPKLLRAYLALGAKICGPPAIDREFKTIDFLTLLDLHSLHPRMQARFFGN